MPARPPAPSTLTLLLLAGCASSSNTIPIQPGPPTPNACSVPPITLTHPAAAPANPAQIIFLDPAKYPAARCNDGSPGAYILRPGIGAAATRFVVQLQGGAGCSNQAACAIRASQSPQETSSTPYRSLDPTLINLTGILSTDAKVNPDFYDATAVQLLYCSSDYWTGAATGTGTFDPNTLSAWNFSGRAILTAIMDDLKQTHSLSSATEFLYTGESAGGLGVFATLNDITPLIPSTTRFAVTAHAGYILDTKAFDPNALAPDYTSPTVPTPVEAGTTEGAAVWKGRGDLTCSNAVTTASAALSCYDPQHLLASGAITQPILIQQAQKDPVLLNTNGLSLADLEDNKLTSEETGYSTWYAAQMRTALAASPSHISIFSPDAFVHMEASENNPFINPYSFPSGTLSDQAALGVWYRDPCTAHSWIQP